MTTITEQRFREGTGVQYLQDGVTIRCQGLAKGQIRKWREEHGELEEPVTPNEDLWPECQCMRAAVPGMFACKWHGGMSNKGKPNPKTIMDVIPVDLRSMFTAIYNDPMYISRHDEISTLRMRNWQLLEEYDGVPNSEEAWGKVADAYKELVKGSNDRAQYLLKEALTDKTKNEKIWQEIRANDTVLKDLTNTQTRTAQVLQSMATTEQVTALVNNIVNTIVEGANKYIHDTNSRVGFLKHVSGRISGFVNFRAGTVIESVTAGSGEDRGITE